MSEAVDLPVLSLLFFSGLSLLNGWLFELCSIASDDDCASEVTIGESRLDCDCGKLC